MKKRYWLKYGIGIVVVIFVLLAINLAFSTRFVCEFSEIKTIVCSTKDLIATYLYLFLGLLCAAIAITLPVLGIAYCIELGIRKVFNIKGDESIK